jgi:hypothetical protein
MLDVLRNRVLAAWQQVDKGNGIFLENQEQKIVYFQNLA